MKKILKSTSLIALSVALMWGCSKDNNTAVTPQQQKASAITAAQDNSQMISATQEMMDATSGAFSEKGVTEGRIGETESGKWWGCKPSISGSFNLNTTIKDSLIYSGTFTIDYGDGSSCPDSLHRRSGKITDTFIYSLSLKNKFLYSSSETVSYVGFHKDTVQIDGTVIMKSATKAPTTVEAQGAKITYSDGSAGTWSGLLSFQYERTKGWRDWGNSSVTVTGSLTGTSRKNDTFSASISKGILFKNSCSGKHEFIPVSGTIDVTTNGANSVVDYGDGSCDKTYTITAGGEVTVHTWDKSSL